MPLSSYALDKYIAQEISQLTECRVVSVASQFPDSGLWLASFGLASIFVTRLQQTQSAIAWFFIRRAVGAIEDYEEARSLLAEFVQAEPGPSRYFRCLRRFESTVALLYQAYGRSMKTLNCQFFAKGDGSQCQRLNSIYNEYRHADPETFPTGHLHPIWMRNEGLFTQHASLTWEELREMVCEIAGFARQLADGAQGRTAP